MAGREPLVRWERERPKEVLALFELALRLWGDAAFPPRERPDQYFLLVILAEVPDPGEPLGGFLEELDPLGDGAAELTRWVWEALGARGFDEGWRARFGGSPSVEAFWLALARGALCQRPEGCLGSLCTVDPPAFARALLARAPEGSWLGWRRKKAGALALDSCQRALLDRLKAVWADELGRKLIRRIAHRLDACLAQVLAGEEASPPFPERFLALPLWWPKVEPWLSDLVHEREECRDEVYLEALLPTFPQIFDELTAPRLRKRPGCRHVRPGLPFWAVGSRSVWARTYAAALEGYAAWAAAACDYPSQKRFFPGWPEVAGYWDRLVDAYMEAFDRLREVDGCEPGGTT